MHWLEDLCEWRRGDLIEQGATTMNPITVFLTLACLMVGAGLGLVTAEPGRHDFAT
jgi:hypothetical protein